MADTGLANRGPNVAQLNLREDDPSCLAIILDLSPAAWGQQFVARKNGDEQRVTCTEFLDQLLFFIHSYLVLQQDNTLIILAAHPKACTVVFPTSTTTEEDALSPRYDIIKQILVEGVPRIMADVEGSTLESGMKLSAALTLALCHIGKLRHLRPNISPRIFTIQVSPDSAPIYISVMNAIFSAKKENISIDSLVLSQIDSPFLQQASSLTEGIYLRPDDQRGLLQYLLSVFLVDSFSRDKLVLPHQSSVDFRAVCFCHKKVVDNGFVCSVCLSIFCDELALCSTCKSKLGVGLRRPIIKKAIGAGASGSSTPVKGPSPVPR